MPAMHTAHKQYPYRQRFERFNITGGHLHGDCMNKLYNWWANYKARQNFANFSSITFIDNQRHIYISN